MKKLILYLLLGISINNCHASLDMLNDELPFAHLTKQVQTAFLMLEDDMPQYAWTPHFKKMCNDIRNNNDMLPCSTVLLAINESLHALALQDDALSANIKSILQEYKEELTTDDSALDTIEFKGHKAKKICKLCTECLTVTQSLNVNGAVIINPPNTRALATALTVNGPEIVNGTLNVNGSVMVNGEPITGGTGATGATGPAGTSLASYGQLSVASQSISLPTVSWVAIPFTSDGPSANMTVSTTSPATITILQNGTYQISVNVYFVVASSSFSATNYMLGLSLNGGSTITAVTAVYAEASQDYALNYSTIMTLSANDSLQFYMEPSTSNSNTVTLETGNAYLMQISN